MGKPPRLTKSTVSINNSKMNVQMSATKGKTRRLQRRRKTNASIKNLFDHLRSESMSSISTIDTTVVEVDKESPSKRKLSPQRSQTSNSRKRQKTDNNASLIIIEDRIGTPCNGTITPRKPSPVSCSTPISISKDNIHKTSEDYIPIVIRPKIERSNDVTVIHNLDSEIQDLTKRINSDSYVTIDLTNETLDCSAINKHPHTVIDLEASNDDCTLVAANTTVSNANLSMSGDSDVTVLNMGSKERKMKNFVKEIAKLDAQEKGNLLELITQNIFSGCKVTTNKGKGSLQNGAPKEQVSQATATVEDMYIKEVILGQVASRNSIGNNSIGSNIYNPERDAKNKTGLRMIVIDGSNVAMEHGRGKSFSVKGLKICIDYFLKRGHTVKAFVPRFRCKFGKSSNPRLLDDLERQGYVVYTPSREIQGRMVTSYDDRYIVQCAAEFDGVIVSGDNYRDLLRENPRWRFVIENRLLPFTWVNDMIMFPRDPLGRTGPSLEQFLKHTIPAPNPANNNNNFNL